MFSVVCSSFHPNLLYSNDTLTLSLSSNTRNLHLTTSSSTRLEFLLKNNGHSGYFSARQHSTDGVVGQVGSNPFLLQSGQFITIKVEELLLTGEEKDNVEFSLEVESRDYLESGEEDDEENVKTDSTAYQYFAPGMKTSVTTTVVLNTVEEIESDDTDIPLANITTPENVCGYVDLCTEAHWMVEFSAQDPGSGMFSLKMKSSDDKKLFWWYKSFKVGGKDQVEGGAWVSCCSDSVLLEVEDVAMNKVVFVTKNESGTKWEVVIPVAVGLVVGIIILSVIGVCCFCRKKYSSVSNTYV